MKIGFTYTFKQLQDYLLKDDNQNVSIIVKNKEYNENAMMHVFRGNFCGDWLAGDGILFYSDGETHSANDEDEFILINIINI